MGRPRISIAQAVVVVLVIAVGLAAVRSGSHAWAGAMHSITFFAMICSLLGVALRRGMARVYWSGFAALGWSYLLLSFAPWLDQHVGSDLLAPSLFVYLLEVLDSAGQANPGQGGLQSVPPSFSGMMATGGGIGVGGASGINLSDFTRIGTSMEALLWAFLGGWVACYFASGRDGPPAQAPVAAGADRQEAEARPVGP